MLLIPKFKFEMEILEILLVASIAGLILLAGSFFWSKRQIKKSLVEIGTAATEKYNCPAREAEFDVV
jgi:hypothetical protein